MQFTTGVFASFLSIIYTVLFFSNVCLLIRLSSYLSDYVIPYLSFVFVDVPLSVLCNPYSCVSLSRDCSCVCCCYLYAYMCVYMALCMCIVIVVAIMLLHVQVGLYT